MPARKPTSLIDPKAAKVSIDERAAREAGEAALTPKTPLPQKPPSALNGKKHAYARAVWVRLIELYEGVEGTIATAFDQDLLVMYCLIEEELIWLSGMREEIGSNVAKINKQIQQIKNPADQFKAYEQYNALTTRLQGFDARLDGKRKLLHALAQSLYLTPRARAGVAPTTKEAAQPDSFGSEFD